MSRRCTSSALALAALLAGCVRPAPTPVPATPAPAAPAAPATPATPAIAHGTVRTDTMWSQALGTHKALVVYLPPSYASDAGRRYPVAYYLHGISGGERDWTAKGGLAGAMDSLVAAGMPEMIVVMPDGDDSWYTTWNSLLTYAQCARDLPRTGPPTTGEPVSTYCVPWQHYDDYIAHDLVAHVDSGFRTIADRAHRGIAGLSMGGYGAISLALEYPEVFSAAASHSGVLSPMYLGPHPYDGRPRWAASMEDLHRQWAGFWKSMEPAFGKDTAAWWSRDPVRRLTIDLARKAPVPALFADVGTSDPFVDENRAFRDRVEALHVPVTYAEWPGGHSWDYWRTHVGQSLTWMAAHIAH